MIWNYNNLPDTSKQVLCLVNIRDEYDDYYEVMWWNPQDSNPAGGFFSKQFDKKGILGLRKECIFRWALID